MGEIAEDQTDLLRFVALRCVVGSRAYGLDQPGSDFDRRGFYLPPAARHWSLAGVPEQIEPNAEEVYWELGKFLRLALKANPTILECLYSTQIELCHPIAQELIEMRNCFLSRHIHRTYNAYVQSQFKKLEQDVRSLGHPRWKHAMHLIRMLLTGITALRDGHLQLHVGPWRERLLSIRAGNEAWHSIDAWRLELHRELDEALATTPLPDEPDHDRVDHYLIRARRFAATESYAL